MKIGVANISELARNTYKLPFGQLDLLEGQFLQYHFSFSCFNFFNRSAHCNIMYTNISCYIFCYIARPYPLNLQPRLFFK